MPALENMRHFETVADQRAKALDIWRLPLRSVLTALYLSADNLFTGGRFIKSPAPQRARGEALLSSVSYVTQYFPSGTLEIGSDIDNALSVIDRSLGKQIRDAVAYASFCEIMPEVHRGYYQVEEVASGFNLRHIVLDAVG